MIPVAMSAHGTLLGCPRLGRLLSAKRTYTGSDGINALTRLGHHRDLLSSSRAGFRGRFDDGASTLDEARDHGRQDTVLYRQDHDRPWVHRQVDWQRLEGEATRVEVEYRTWERRNEWTAGKQIGAQVDRQPASFALETRSVGR